MTLTCAALTAVTPVSGQAALAILASGPWVALAAQGVGVAGGLEGSYRTLALPAAHAAAESKVAVLCPTGTGKKYSSLSTSVFMQASVSVCEATSARPSVFTLAFTHQLNCLCLLMINKWPPHLTLVTQWACHPKLAVTYPRPVITRRCATFVALTLWGREYREPLTTRDLLRICCLPYHFIYSSLLLHPCI